MRLPNGFTATRGDRRRTPSHRGWLRREAPTDETSRGPGAHRLTELLVAATVAEHRVDLLAGIPPLEELELEGQRVLVRADLDLAVDAETGAVLGDAPLVAAMPTFEHVVGRGARLVIAAHRGSPQGKPTRALSLEPVGSRLAELTGWEVLLPEECVGDVPRKLVAELRTGQVCLLENLRFDPGEEQDDETFVRELGRLADVFVADALGVLRLEHGSVVGLPQLLRHRTAGLALRRELEAFTRFDQPLTSALLGGAFSVGVPLVEALVRRSVPLLLGGPLGSTLLAAQGVQSGRHRRGPRHARPGAYAPRTGSPARS